MVFEPYSVKRCISIHRISGPGFSTAASNGESWKDGWIRESWSLLLYASVD
jgi:hypothetical protein